MDRNNKLKLFLIPTLLSLSLPAVFAQGIQGILNNLFKGLNTLITTDHTKFGLTFIAFFIVLYGVFSAGLNAVPAFKADGKLSKNGKLIAVGMSLLGVIGIFVTTDGRPYDVTKNVLEAFGIYGAIFVSVLIFLMLYFAFKDTDFYNDRQWQLLICYLGIAMFLGGVISNHTSWSDAAVIFLIIGGFFLLSSLITSGGDDEGGGPLKGIKDFFKPKGPKSPPAAKTPKGPVPNGVNGIEIKWDPEKKTVNISWEPNPDSDEVTTYVVRKARYGSPRWGNPIYSSPKVRDKSNPLPDTAVEPKKTYVYKITAYNNNGESSGEKYDITIPPPDEVPPEPVTAKKGKTEKGEKKEKEYPDLNIEITSPQNNLEFLKKGDYPKPEEKFVRLEGKAEGTAPYAWAWYVKDEQAGRGDRAIQKIGEGTGDTIREESLDLSQAAPGKREIYLTVRDSGNKTGNAKITINVKEEGALSVVILTKDGTEFPDNASVNIKGVVSDKKIPKGTKLWIDFLVNGEHAKLMNEVKNSEEFEINVKAFEQGKEYKVGIVYYEEATKKWKRTDENKEITIKVGTAEEKKEEDTGKKDATEEVVEEIKKEEKIIDDMQEEEKQIEELMTHFKGAYKTSFEAMQEALISIGHGTFSRTAVAQSIKTALSNQMKSTKGILTRTVNHVAKLNEKSESIRALAKKRFSEKVAKRNKIQGSDPAIQKQDQKFFDLLSKLDQVALSRKSSIRLVTKSVTEFTTTVELLTKSLDAKPMKVNLSVQHISKLIYIRETITTKIKKIDEANELEKQLLAESKSYKVSGE